MDAPNHVSQQEAAQPTAAPAPAPAGTAAPVDPLAGQTAKQSSSNATEHQSQLQEQYPPPQVLQTQNAQPSASNQQPTQPNPNQQNPAAQQRQRVMARDRYNHQSLGASLNSSVKQVRLVLESQFFFFLPATLDCLECNEIIVLVHNRSTKTRKQIMLDAPRQNSNHERWYSR